MQACMVLDCRESGETWFGGTLLCTAHAHEVERRVAAASEQKLVRPGR